MALLLKEILYTYEKTADSFSVFIFFLYISFYKYKLIATIFQIQVAGTGKRFTYGIRVYDKDI